MTKFSEETFDNWRKPASESEEQRISNAISLIKDAINASQELKDKDIEIFVQGSYANDTNVRTESDVDVCVMLKETFYDEYPEGLTRADYGFIEGTNNFSEFRRLVLKALTDKYGNESVKPGNKSIKITSTSHHVEADAVPSFHYRNYKYINSRDPEKYVEGVKLISQNTNETIINYPKIHIDNGIAKNTNTQRRYKRLVRIFKRIKSKMIDDGIPVNNGITSFLIECLLWNVPDNYFNNHDTWTERIKQIIIYLYEKTEKEIDHKEWGEVSEMLYLFHSSKKWDAKMGREFLVQMWNYLEF